MTHTHPLTHPLQIYADAQVLARDLNEVRPALVAYAEKIEKPVLKKKATRRKRKMVINADGEEEEEYEEEDEEDEQLQQQQQQEMSEPKIVTEEAIELHGKFISASTAVLEVCMCS